MKTKPEIFVAMSGGVDSSVAAALLVEQGFRVTGIMLQLWNGDPELQTNSAKIKMNIDNAKKVTKQLGIPFVLYDAMNVFKEKIVAYFLNAHLGGLTPNPCFVCNQKIKWGLLLDEISRRGADFLATGHYAQILRNQNGSTELHRGSDHRKDQSYVLAGLTQDQISRAILPLGALTKTEVRKIAHSYNLPNFDSPDSQDLCFFGNLKQDEFLKIYSPESQREGEILFLDGKVIGTHNGLSNYTIGQRKGLGAGFSEPIFVIAKNVGRNQLIVGTKKDLGTKKIRLEKINWISGQIPQMPMQCEVKIRYKATTVKCEISPEPGNALALVFRDKARDATPGQFAVFYDGDLVLGSGVISETWGENL